MIVSFPQCRRYCFSLVMIAINLQPSSMGSRAEHDSFCNCSFLTYRFFFLFWIDSPCQACCTVSCTTFHLFASVNLYSPFTYARFFNCWCLVCREWCCSIYFPRKIYILRGKLHGIKCIQYLFIFKPFSSGSLCCRHPTRTQPATDRQTVPSHAMINISSQPSIRGKRASPYSLWLRKRGKK